MTAASLRPHAYVLAVRDLHGSARYFADSLGFAEEWRDDDNWRGMIRDGVRVMLGRCPDAIPPADLGDHGYFGFLATEDVDALHADLVARGALILAGPADKPWGWRELAVGTPEGHRMMFAQAI